MKVTGPNWPSTVALKTALAGCPSETTLEWGQRGKDGLEQLQAFAAAGIPTPEFTTDLTTAKAWVRAGSSVFGRLRLHTQGSDIVGAGWTKPRVSGLTMTWIRTKKGSRVRRPRQSPDQPERWNRQWLEREFWVKVLPTEEEFRQHVWNNRCIRVGKKVHTGTSNRTQPVRSRSNGWTIDYAYQTPEELKESIRETAKRAVTSIDYPGGAVDLVLAGGVIYVLEVNAAPSLKDEKTLSAYVEAITKQFTPAKQGKKKEKV